MLHVTILLKSGEGVDWYAEKAFSHKGDIVLRDGFDPVGARFTQVNVGLDGVASWTIASLPAVATLTEVRARRHE